MKKNPQFRRVFLSAVPDLLRMLKRSFVIDVLKIMNFPSLLHINKVRLMVHVIK